MTPVHCPDCGFDFSVKGNAQGKVTWCPNCKTVVRIPGELSPSVKRRRILIEIVAVLLAALLGAFISWLCWGK